MCKQAALVPGIFEPPCILKNRTSDFALSFLIRATYFKKPLFASLQQQPVT